jgi:hypothetical protein
VLVAESDKREVFNVNTAADDFADCQPDTGHFEN